ncbi:MAG TPA: hypothetical protein VFX98_18260 [Longimicrobiaceae bacterium]|nr:hypothetical protein [Longimicrobiaceae bacterium]
MERIAIPFRFSVMGTDWSSEVAVQGLLRLEADDLVLEFREAVTRYSTMRTKQGPVRTLRLPFAEIAGVELRRGFFGGATLVVRSRRMQPLDALPNADAGEVRLKIARRDRALAEEFAISLRHELAERDLRALDAPGAVPLPP